MLASTGTTPRAASTMEVSGIFSYLVATIKREADGIL